ncbi:SAM-dependent DNA methyltransferase [Arthrobacter sp. zg-Y820]|uniref:DNA methyltransferase n=1 Tax=unclassified Arthrobacter TaxID=235627 RepID=UPI001E471712|nr:MULTISPECIES: DNA methyltransferase [unclassified Arthrobacter]MCC9195308.1 SAM-dependent DNA methyltransferase [Arthrobacter sp. zg-Y820]MDK1278167.1 SAM-dependent DNA methyltransferase [Arthrobacter sp. zg.Y820]WIB10053.1 SAM-dependent DNA methyltransferase [Arthrobacter sp. zg-Y820]
MNIAARNALQQKIQTSHASWIQAFDIEGPFISVPVAKKAWGDVVPRLSAEAHEAFKLRFADFIKAYDALDAARLDALTELSTDTEQLNTHLKQFRDTQSDWVSFVLRDLCKWGERYETFAKPNPEFTARNPMGTVTTSATGRLLRDGKTRALLLTVDPVESLRQDGKDGWSANLIDRMGEMLRKAEIPCGIVTDGRWWSVVWADTRKDATRVSTIGSGITDGLNWASDLLTRDAYINLANLKSFSGADLSHRLDALIADSLLDAEQITESLGTQVRSAVELLVQAFSENSLNARRRGLRDPLPADTHSVYEAAVTVMMRVVFLLFAEERGLMPTGEMYRTSYSMAGQLNELDERKRHDGDESLERTEVWHRLLAASRALYEGASFDDVRMPAYGGSLFDPERFPWMEGSSTSAGLAIRVSDRVMLEVLRSVQYAETGTGRTATRQKLSFRDIDVEQIGYIYEGLIGYTCKRVPTGQIVLGIVGKPGAEPEITLAKLEELYRVSGGDDETLARKLISFWKADQPGADPKTPAQLAKTLSAIDEPQTEEVDLKIRHLIDDEERRHEIASWGNLIRRDLRGIPYVVPEGGVVVHETKSRANAGAHYTPRSLAEEVVLHALQPLCYEPGPLQTADSSLWKLKSSTEILNLRVADIAVGSGAFLVAAARYLGERLLEAWQQESTTANETSRRDLNLAIREVVSQCLYGADINEMAVEMCKLSLWLVSLDPKKPFSFVDDKVLHGNSLLGLTSLKQLRGLHIDPSARRLANPGFTVDVDSPLQKAADIRAQLATPIADQADLDPQRSARHKKMLLAESKEVTEQLRAIADGIVAAGLLNGGKPSKTSDEVYENLAFALLRAYPNAPADADCAMLTSITGSGLAPTVETDYIRWKPLHWIIEVPDVMITHGGFDAIVGNPPFLGGQKLTGSMGENFRNWLVYVIAHGRRGSSDLVGYFFLRAAALLRPEVGQLGLIGTDSVAQGATREVALDPLLQSGLIIRRAIRSEKWPAKSASVRYSAVWGSLAPLEPGAETSSDGNKGKVLSTLATEDSIAGAPKKLFENDGLAYQGCILLGPGFILSRESALNMIEKDPINRSVLTPYLIGEDLNSLVDGVSQKWVINFGNRTYDAAAKFVEPMSRVRELVYPVRMNNTRKARRERWWQFAEKSAGLTHSIAQNSRVLVIAQVSPALAPVFVAADNTFDQQLVVFTPESYAFFAAICSSFHVQWVIEYGLTKGSNPVYTPKSVLQTFPFPELTTALEEIGKEFDELRSEVMIERQLGLTKLYGLINSPDCRTDDQINNMRNMIRALDEAMLSAYGWTDIALGHDFHVYNKVQKWTIAPDARRQVLDRLLQENHRRSLLELHNEVPNKARRSGTNRRLPGTTDAQERMF